MTRKERYNNNHYPANQEEMTSFLPRIASVEQVKAFWAWWDSGRCRDKYEANEILNMGWNSRFRYFIKEKWDKDIHIITKNWTI